MSDDRAGPALLALGLLALLRCGCAPGPPPAPERAGAPFDLTIEALAGDRFRLLPGVGPVLAGRLEAARLAAGGRLAPDDLARVRGIGPALLSRWGLR